MGKLAICQSVLTPPNGAGVKEALRMTVRNTGNLLFQNAVLKQLRHGQVFSDWSELDEDVETVVLTLANFLTANVGDLSKLVSDIEKSKISNVVLIGIGTQCDVYKENVSIDPAAIRLVSIVSERSRSVGVRGYYTAEILAGLGIKNVDVIGCPSIFTSCSPKFRQFKGFPTSNPGLTLAPTPTGKFRDRFRALMEFGRIHNADYVMQSEEHLIPLINDPPDLTNQQVLFFKKYYGVSGREDELVEWLYRNIKIFFDVDSWMNYCARRDFFIGNRLHGNVVALLSGVKALTLTFDSRTRELAEFLSLPSMPFGEFDGTKPLEWYYDRTDTDLFRDAYLFNYFNYVSFLDKNLIPHNLEVNASGFASQEFELIALEEHFPRIADRVKVRNILHHVRNLSRRSCSSSDLQAVLNLCKNDRSEEDMSDIELGKNSGSVETSRYF